MGRRGGWVLFHLESGNSRKDGAGEKPDEEEDGESCSLEPFPLFHPLFSRFVSGPHVALGARSFGSLHNRQFQVQVGPSSEKVFSLL